MELDEPVHIVDYNPNWPRLYETELARIRQALPASVIEIAHIGSTAVPGLPAKPVIDILVGLPTLNLSEPERSGLLSLGYEDLGEAGVPGRLHFRRRTPDAYNVHVTKWRGDLWNNNIILRDYLRANPQEALRYGAFKRTLIDSGTTRLLRYSQIKGPFMAALLEQAMGWTTGRET